MSEDLRRFGFWFFIGTTVAVFLVWIQVAAVGGLAGLLSVGESSNLRPMIEAELGKIPVAPGGGHDGQFTYVIGSDLDGDLVADELDHASYRYRRILLPAVASLFGLLDGTTLLWGITVSNVLSLGLASGALALILDSTGRSPWAQLGLLANPGVWLSIHLSTVDVLAIAFSLVAVAVWLRDRRWVSVGALALAVLAKDQYLLVALSLFIADARSHSIRHATPFLTAPALTLAAWAGVLTVRLGDGFSARGNLGMPLGGIIEASSVWSEVPTKDLALSILLVAAIALSTALALVPRNRSASVFVAPWIAIALLSTDWVWDLGNNSARAFAPLLLWVAFAVTPGAEPSGRMDAGSVEAASTV